MISVLALMSVIVGFCCTQSTLTVVDAASAALDAKAQANAIEAILKGGSFTDTGHLTELQTRLVALNGDLVRVQAAIPGPVAGTSAGVNLDRTLTMALHPRPGGPLWHGCGAHSDTASERRADRHRRRQRHANGQRHGGRHASADGHRLDHHPRRRRTTRRQAMPPQVA